MKIKAKVGRGQVDRAVGGLATEEDAGPCLALVLLAGGATVGWEGRGGGEG